MKTIYAKNFSDWSEVPDDFTGIIIDEDGNKIWYQNGLWHRTDGGPAVEYPNGYKAWWQNNQVHRLDGPAVEFSDGYKEYYVLGQILTENRFQIFQVMWERTLLERNEELMKIFLKLAKMKQK